MYESPPEETHDEVSAIGQTTVSPSGAGTSETAPEQQILCRYGQMPQVARFSVASSQTVPERGDWVVVQTERGEELACALQQTRVGMNKETTGALTRAASAEDMALSESRRANQPAEFDEWLGRFDEWNLQIELIDLERTLDNRIILYVLSDRSADTTRLALLGAANGYGIIHVQPVSGEGIVPGDSGGGCGSSGGGCGCGH